jgi:hypothetical protein
MAKIQTETFLQTPPQISRDCDHIMVSEMGFTGSAYCCAQCGLYVFEREQEADFLPLCRAMGNVIDPSHPQYEALKKHALEARAKVDAGEDPRPIREPAKCKPLEHIMVEGFGMYGDAVTCATCGLSLYDDAEIFKGRIITANHPEHKRHFAMAEAARAAANPKIGPTATDPRPIPEPCQHDHVEKPGLARYCLHQCRAVLKDWGFWIGVTVSFPIEHFLWEHIWPFRLLTNLLGL